jgi:hypothetical protein
VPYSWWTVSLGKRVRSTEVPEDIELHHRLALRSGLAGVLGFGCLHGGRNHSRPHCSKRRHVWLPGMARHSPDHWHHGLRHLFQHFSSGPTAFRGRLYLDLTFSGILRSVHPNVGAFSSRKGLRRPAQLREQWWLAYYWTLVNDRTDCTVDRFDRVRLLSSHV